MTAALRGLAPRAGPPRRFAGRRLVGVLRWALPAVAALLIGVVMAWPQVADRGAGLIAPMFAPHNDGSDAVMRMHQPRYAGQTKDAEPFEVTAAAAALDPFAPELVHLERPAADIAASGPRDIHLAAAAGIYDRDRGRLDLSGGIAVTTSDGYRFDTPSASVNFERGRVVGREPITGAGPAGTLSAQRFEFEDGGEVLRFKGRVRMTWNPGVDVGS
jgi:lipopolysaccharide export system protein LptC